METNDLIRTDIDKATKNPHNNPRFDLSYFSQADNPFSLSSNMVSEQDKESKTLKRAKEILGESYTKEEVKSIVASFEYLIHEWMEEYERKVFGNKSLQEVLREL